MLGWPQLEDKESFGCSPFDTVISLPTSPLAAHGSKDSLKEAKVDSCTGRSLSPSGRKQLWPELLACSANIMRSSRGQKRQASMYGKKRQEFRQPSLNLEHSLQTPLVNQTGKWYGSAPSPEILTQYPHSFGLKVIVPSERLEAISLRLTQWYVHAKCFGVLQERENRKELGKRQESTLTLSLHAPSFGTVTSLKKILSSMSLEEILILGTYSPGWTVIPSVWKLKDHQYLSTPRDSGSAVI